MEKLGGFTDPHTVPGSWAIVLGVILGVLLAAMFVRVLVPIKPGLNGMVGTPVQPVETVAEEA